MRLFIAIDLPQNIQKILINLQSIIKHETNIDARLVKPEQIHLTLAFLGDCTQQQLDAVQAALKTIQQKPFTVCLNKCGVFPDTKRPRILWVNLINGALQELAEKIRKAVFDSVKLEDREFKAHVTIARIKKVHDKKEFERFLQSITLPQDCFEVVEFTVQQSELSSEGAQYTTLERYSL